MIALTLRQIADAVGGELHLVGSGLTAASVITGPVETDSREIVPGGIFVAKPGAVTDGHLFAPVALERGATLLILERALDLPVAQVVVADAVVALGALASDVVARVRALGRLKVCLLYTSP